jgi:UDP-N-acetylmuramoyl-L-alanyl-D-glutamate--2,6-diaminopimelate ligase
MSAALMWLLDGIAKIPASDARVSDLTLDSRQARAGSLFFALPGLKDQGLKFAADAVSRGATAVLWEPVTGASAGAALAPPPALPPDVFVAAVPDLKSLVGRIADRFFNWPSSQLRITGITGTNGKTTCAYLLAQCLERLGQRAAYMGTIGWGRPDALTEPTHTTPDAVTVHRTLAQLRVSGVREVAMEVSSHALDQGRVDEVRFNVAAFTNLTRDHLDYHGSMQAYGAAKAKLFESRDLKHVVLNIGDEFGRVLARDIANGASLIAVWAGAGDSGWLADRELHATQVRMENRGISIDLDGSFGKTTVKTQLIGRFNAENSLVVIACLLSLGVPLAEAATALADCKPAPGRMEIVKTGARNKPTVVVDYAHTPDALSKALSAAREHCEGALWCVFGCGGDRDAGKRPVMGAIAESLADQIIVTDDNPRSEDPQAITRDILSGIKSRAVRVIHDRGAAIGAALKEAQAIDLVLIAGKGHEDYQIYGDTRRAFSDRDEALRYLGAAA